MTFTRCDSTVAEMPHKDHLQYFFPTVVQVSEIEGAVDLNRRLLAAIEEIKATVPNAKPRLWSCNLYTTINDPSSANLLEREPFSEMTEIILGEIHKYGRALSIDVEKWKPRIDDFWVNVYGRGHAQEVHLHHNCLFSGIYYVKAPKRCGDLMFHSPMADHYMDPPRSDLTALNAMVANWIPREGQMLIFRSSLKHSVQPNAIEEPRVSLAFNVNL